MLSLRCGPSLPGTVLPTQRMKKAPPNLQLSSAALCMPALNLSTWGSVRAGYGSTVPSYADPSAYAGRRHKDFARELARLLPRKRRDRRPGDDGKRHAYTCYWMPRPASTVVRSRKRSASERDGEAIASVA
jgi:hypothetical protein